MRVYNDFFGRFGGRYVAEMLRAPLEELETAFIEAMDDDRFRADLDGMLRDFAGRPTPLVFAENATRELGGARIWVKMEGLAHTGAHKINNAVGQALLARRMGKRRVIAETGAGQHGVATAAVCAKLASPAGSTWERSTCAGNGPTSSGCSSTAPRSSRSAGDRPP